MRISGADGEPQFVKTAAADELPAFEAEAAGLEELRAANAVRVPRVLGVGVSEGRAYIALEWLELAGPNRAVAAALGEQLAGQHRVSAARFGWHRSNSIGRTPQTNEPDADWIQFFRERRLRYQLDLAASNSFGGSLQKRGAELLERMEGLFDGHRPLPSLLHGALWGGNWGATADGCPVIFDPAVYFGDREADIAMTRLFGGFDTPFYEAYQAAWPLAAGWQARTTLYNLYHVLNHLNIFGAGYFSQAESMIGRLLAELRA